MTVEIRKDHTYTLVEWKELILNKYPKATITQEDGSGKTYGDVGEWTAHIGPDMQADVVGVFTAEFCSIWTTGLPGYKDPDCVDLACDGNVGV